MSYLKNKLNEVRLANEKLDDIRKGGFHLYYDFIQDDRLDGIDLWVLNYLIDVEPIVEHLASDRRYFMICERFALEGLKLRKATLYYKAIDNLLDCGYIAKLENGHSRCYYTINYSLILHQYNLWCHNIVDDINDYDDQIDFNDDLLNNKYESYVEGNPTPVEVEKPKAKKKEKEVDKDDETISEILKFLNEKTGKNYRDGSGSTKLIRARIKDGYSLDDFKKVIQNKCDEWIGTEWETYLRPNTLFAPSHFDDYLNQSVRKKNDSNYDRMKVAYNKAGSNGSIMDPDKVKEQEAIRQDTYKKNEEYSIIRQNKNNTILWANINKLIEDAVDSGRLNRKYRTKVGEYDPRLSEEEAVKLFSNRDFLWIENKFKSGCVMKEEYLNGIE